MIIELLGWSSEGLRCPDVELRLDVNDAVPKIALIQMPNGTGKTTTLSMLRAAMTGEAKNWSPETVRNMRRPGQQTNQGVFALNLRVDSRPLTLEVRLDFDNGTASYRTSSPGLGGVVQGWKPPQEVERFLDERFVRLFVFDGEFADKLLQAGYSEAQQAIDALFQLYLLEELHAKAQEMWEQAATKKSVKTETGLSMYRNKASKLAAKIAQVNKVLADATAQIEILEPQIKDLDDSIRDRIGSQEELRHKLDSARERELKADAEAQRTSALVMTLARQPHVLYSGFADSLVQMKNQLDRLRLPTSTTSQFFTELLEEENCICGRPLDEKTRAVLKERAALYLAEDTSGVLNWMKRDIDANVSQDGASNAATLDAALEALSAAVAEKSAAGTAVRALRQKLIEQGDDKLKADEEELEKKQQKREKLLSLREEMSRPASSNDDENTKCLQSLKKQLLEAENKVAEITGTIELREKKDIVQRILTSALQLARGRLRALILKEMNDRLKRVLYRDPIEVASIDSSVRLKFQEGASVGQTLSVGYVFLTTLLNRGQHQFPLVIDSPANPLSIEVRREVGKLIPELTEQFVGFTISSERAGFVRQLDLSSQGNIRYFTMFRKTSGTASLLAQLPDSGVRQTDTGVLVEGREYFQAFDLEEES